uniref:INO80 complex subunit B-like conserved region domain-containing protein n=1 Tax=Physcomitrium patens TaxID=3218 RepID=A0A7I4CEL4_PHYPA
MLGLREGGRQAQRRKEGEALWGRACKREEEGGGRGGRGGRGRRGSRALRLSGEEGGVAAEAAALQGDPRPGLLPLPLPPPPSPVSFAICCNDALAKASGNGPSCCSSSIPVAAPPPPAAARTLLCSSCISAIAIAVTVPTIIITIILFIASSAGICSREPLRSEHPSSAHDRSAERRPGDRYVDVTDVGGSRADMGPERKEYRKDDKYYSRHSSKDTHSIPTPSGRHFGRGDKFSGDKYEGEGRGGGRDDYRGGKEVGRSRDYDSRSLREERGSRYDGNGFKDSGRESGYRGGDRREEGRLGRGDDRAATEERGKYSSRRDEYRDTKIFSRKEKFSDRRFHGKDDAKQEKGDWRESNGTRRPEHERVKRLEKSMKDIVNVERPARDDIDEYLGDGRGNDRNKSARFRERDGFDSGKEKLSRDASHTPRVNLGEKHGAKEANLKCTEKDTAEHKVGGFTKLKLKVGGITHTIVSDSAKKADGTAASSAANFVHKSRESEPAGANRRRRQRLILQDQSDDDEEFYLPPPKAPRKTENHNPGFVGQTEQTTPNGDKVNSASKSEHPKTIALGSGSSLQGVRKSSRVPKRRVMDGDEEDVDMQRPSASSKGGRFVEDEVEKESGDAEEESSEDVGKPVDEDSGGGLVGDDDDEDEEDETEPVKPEKLQQSRPTKEVVGSGMALTARQRAMQTSKDADRESAPSLIEYPEGLTNPLSRKGKINLSEAERQVKRVEAAHRRKQQVEKTARDIQATAIQRILGQDSTRKRRENRLEKQRQDIQQVRLILCHTSIMTLCSY